MAGISLGDAPKDEKWLLHVDGSSTIQGSSAGTVITSPQGEDLEFAVIFDFKASNNEAEYKALMEGMKMIHEAGARHLIAYSNSQLDASQTTDGKQPGSRLEPFDSSYKEESSIRNPIHTLYFSACLNKKESMSSKKYIVDAVGHMQGHGY
ncbi:UNVERIFIED_CONTAM: hypothetical protein Slati_3435400 [Sesamum latifolium]|uniref:RNase H type-1 domain-containing protein n=1 Tax=Sesamum latifolium TaxID=2727402 RepID=A0AAW2UFE1_9LAMI